MTKQTCTQDLIALKSFFLGPKAENAVWVRKLAYSTFISWFKWRQSFHPTDARCITKSDQETKEFQFEKEKIKSSLDELVDRFEKEIPYFSPRYVGHMLSEISVPALLGHIVTLLHNPNNIAEEVSLVGSQIETEAIEALCKMLNFDLTSSRGHFTSGGTIANFEGLVRARARIAHWMSLGCWLQQNKLKDLSLFESAHLGWKTYDEYVNKQNIDSLRALDILHNNPFTVADVYEQTFNSKYRGPVVLVSSSKHYSWPKGIMLLGLGGEAFWQVKLDVHGKMSIKDLKNKIALAEKQNRPILAVISVAGTTELGDFDLIDEVQHYLTSLKNDRGIHIWHHVDGAYGGFFASLSQGKNSPISKNVKRSLKALNKVNSITIDPHKLGYVPYSSGTFICKNTREYYVSPFDAPYLRFEQGKGVGTQTLEGSRSAGGAVATWLTSKTIGFDPSGSGKILEMTIKNRLHLETLLRTAHPLIHLAPSSETNIACFCLADNEEPLSTSNERTEKIYAAFAPLNEKLPFFVSKTHLNFSSYDKYLHSYISNWKGVIDTDHLTLIRLCLMNPFFGSTGDGIDYSEEFIKCLNETISNL